MKKILIFVVLALVVGTSPALVSGLTLDLEYSTYLGGASGTDSGRGITLGMDGMTYITGYTYMDYFPTVNPYQPVYGGGTSDAFVTAFSSTGSTLFYSTYLGGSGDDNGYGISLGTDGRVYVTGETDSPNFPTENPYQAGFGGNNDAFLSALSSSGSVLSYSTYLGGSAWEISYGISLGTDGVASVIGETSSTDFPTENPYQAGFGGDVDVFVSQLTINPSASLVFSTYLGGSGDDRGYGISLGTDGVASVTGETDSSDFPTENPYQAGPGGNRDVFVSQLAINPSASLVFSTYLGGSNDDYGYGISVGTDNIASITGKTYSSDFPTENPFQAIHAGGQYDVFISALTSTGSDLTYSTYLGGSFNDIGYGISRGADGTAYVTGQTRSLDFPTENPYQAAAVGTYENAFVSALTSTGSALSYSTYLSGGGNDIAYAISLGPDGLASVTGTTSSSDFPVEDAYQSSKGGGQRDAFVSRFALIATPSSTVTPTPSVTPTATTTPTVAAPTATTTVVPPTTPTIPPTTTPSVTPTPTCGPTIDPQSGIIASADYDGDNTADIAIFRPGSGLWAIRGISRAYFGASGDLPVPGDYSGDDTSEMAIYRGSSGLWAIKELSRLYMGSASIPAPGDYDGDGFCDAGVFTDSSGRWQIKDVTLVYFGQSLDWPVARDFNGDGSTDIGIFRHSTGLWAIQGYTRAYFGGQPDDWPVAGDYDGDGIEEIAIWRPCVGLWALRGLTRSYYGTCLDWPRPADYDGTGTDDLGIYREVTGLWAVRGIFRAYYGRVGDIPATR